MRISWFSDTGRSNKVYTTGEADIRNSYEDEMLVTFESDGTATLTFEMYEFKLSRLETAQLGCALLKCAGGAE